MVGIKLSRVQYVIMAGISFGIGTALFEILLGLNFARGILFTFGMLCAIWGVISTVYYMCPPPGNWDEEEE